MKTRFWTTLALVCGLVAVPAFAADAQSDGMTTLKVKLALLDKLGTDSLHIDVDSTGGAVALHGTVAKRETAELASTIAKSVAGVSKVDNDVRVENAAAKTVENAAKEADSELKDALLETRIRIALVDGIGTDGFAVGTEAASGVVTLEFDKQWNAAQRQKAVAAVRGVAGVEKVVSVDKKG